MEIEPRETEEKERGFSRAAKLKFSTWYAMIKEVFIERPNDRCHHTSLINIIFFIRRSTRAHKSNQRTETFSDFYIYFLNERK